MDINEARELKRSLLKYEIRVRLHRYNPTRFPKPESPFKCMTTMVSSIIRMELAIKGNPFEADNVLYKLLRNREKMGP